MELFVKIRDQIKEEEHKRRKQHRQQQQQQQEEEEQQEGNGRGMLRPVVPYKAKFSAAGFGGSGSGSGDESSAGDDRDEPRDFFNAFSADDSTGHVSASSPTDPHRCDIRTVLVVETRCT